MSSKKRMQFATTIQAPRERVWELMLAPDSYREWTAPFTEGSYYEGSWEQGGRIRFMAPGMDGGMVADVLENRRGEFVSLKHIGMLKDGVVDTDSPEVRAWAPAYENYRFVDLGGGATEVHVEMDVTPDWEQHMQEAWPRALAALKALCERRTAA